MGWGWNNRIDEEVWGEVTNSNYLFWKSHIEIRT